ncbi:MAG TPA: PorV/PorQ family protein [bacterium]|nr:PorV/PorQ family protein [bacterium]
MGKVKFIAALVLLPAVLFAAGGTTGADILKLNTGCRAIAMGEAFSAAGDRAESLWYNPAGIAFHKKHSVFYSHHLMAHDVTAVQASYAGEVETFLLDGKGGLFFVWRFLPLIDNEDAEDEPVEYYDVVFGGTFAMSLNQIVREWPSDIGIGIAAKIVLEQIGPHSGSTIAFDAGVKYEPADTGLAFALAVQNAGLPIRAIRGAGEPDDPSFEEFPIPLTARAGAAYRFSVDENNRSLIALDYMHDLYDYPRAAVGLEHGILELLYLRAGYNTSFDTRNPAYVSAGAGIYTTQFDVSVGINYAYRVSLFGSLNAPLNSHFFSADVRF